jgi:hypothetical protein
MAELVVIESDRLEPDPDVQLSFAFNEKWQQWLYDNFDLTKVHVLVVVPAEPGRASPGVTHWIIDGRHRFLAGIGRNVSKWRCDLHKGVVTPAQKAELKLSMDQDRRRPSSLEHFVERTIAEEPVAVAITQIVESKGFKVGKTGGRGTPWTNIEAVGRLEAIYAALGPEGLSRTLALNTTWYDEPKTNTTNWLGGLAAFVDADYDIDLSPDQYRRLKEMIPGKVVREALGEASYGGGGRGARDFLSRLIAEKMRKTAKVRRR